MPAISDAILSEPVVRVAICAFLDIADDPLRHALSPVGPLLMPSSSILARSDPNFDGQVFTTLDPRMVSISAVEHGPGGAEAVEFTVSGTLGMDADMMTALSDPARFRGRLAQLWLVRLGAAWQPTHARAHYTGYMSTPSFQLDPPNEDGEARQTTTLRAENYLALIGGGAPARTQMWSPDPDDRAAAATVGASGATAALGDRDFDSTLIDFMRKFTNR